MEYRVIENTVLLRLDPGEEICASLLKVAEQEDIRFAAVTGIGAVNEFATGVFDTEKKEYLTNRFSGAYEITSLTGTLSRLDGKPYLHVHMSAGDARGQVFGGHLIRAVISATAELVLQILPGEAARRFNRDVGLNLLDFG